MKRDVGRNRSDRGASHPQFIARHASRMVTIPHEVKRNCGQGISSRQLQFEVEVLASSNSLRSPRRFEAPHSQCALASNQQGTPMPNRSDIKMARERMSVEHGSPAKSKHPVIDVYISRKCVDRGGIFHLIERCYL